MASHADGHPGAVGEWVEQTPHVPLVHWSRLTADRDAGPGLTCGVGFHIWEVQIQISKY